MAPAALSFFFVLCSLERERERERKWIKEHAGDNQRERERKRCRYVYQINKTLFVGKVIRGEGYVKEKQQPSIIHIKKTCY